MPSFFAGALGARNPSIARSAKATWSRSAPVTCMLCVLQDFQGQSGDITVGGGLAVGRNLTFDAGSGSVTVNGSGDVSYGGMWDTHGTFTVNGAAATPVKLTSPMTDPFAGLPAPPIPPFARGRPGSGSCDPGTYSDLSGCSSLTGGVYIVTGNGTTDTPVTLPAGSPTNTLIYFTCGRAGRRSVRPQACDGALPGAYLAGSNGAATIGGLTQGARQGFAVIYDRNNIVDETLSGSGALTIDGDIYGPSVTADFSGNGAGSVTVNGRVVVGGVVLRGNGQNEQFDVPGAGTPPTVAPGTPVHLIP